LSVKRRLGFCSVQWRGLFWVAFLVWALAHVLDASLCVWDRLGRQIVLYASFCLLLEDGHLFFDEKIKR
jgi:hypothetical protein